jgi:hypothetical protein
VGFLVRELTAFEVHAESVGGRGTDSLRGRVSRGAAGSLEEDGGRRAALLAGAVEGYAGAGLGLELASGMTADLSEDERCFRRGEVDVAERREDGRISRAGFGDVG